MYGCDGVTSDECRPRALRWPDWAGENIFRGHWAPPRLRFLMVGAPPPIICRRAARPCWLILFNCCVAFFMLCMISLEIVVKHSLVNFK